MMRQLLFLAAIAICSLGHAQGEFSGGFKAGLNFNTLLGPLENENEQTDFYTGFHIGATFVYTFTDLFGVKGELMYSQKGTRYAYEGPSYFTFYTTNTATPIYALGDRRVDISVSNAYIDVPLMLYYKIGPVELEAGVNAGFLIGSGASGGITFSGATLAGSPVEEFTTGIEASYFNNDRGVDAIRQTKEINLNTLQAFLPESIDAYYEGNSSEDNKFKRLDLGVNAGIAFFLNEGLYVGIRANYGLNDITNEIQDISPVALGANNTYQTRDDDDTNLSFQTSVGFRF